MRTTSGQFGILASRTSQTFPMTEPVSGRKPVLVLLMRLLWAAAFALPVFGAQAGAVLTTLYSFTGGDDGSQPWSGVVQGRDGYFYGTTWSGGANHCGTVFKISPDWMLTSLYSFTGGRNGGYPNGLMQGSDGNFYGTTSSDQGTVFTISTNGALRSLGYFGAGDDNGQQGAGLVQGSDGYFYGTAAGGGNMTIFGGAGTVFKVSVDGTFTTLYLFTGTNDGGGPNGLVQGSDGSFYGTTEWGGTTGNGTVFKSNGLNRYGAWMLVTLHSFTGGEDGAQPWAGLVQGSDGYFYGTTSGGGAYTNKSGQGFGTVFKISYGALTSLYSFTGTNDGANPVAALVQGSDGNFYGTTQNGGTNGQGTVFRVTSNGTLTSLYSFTGGNDGAIPQAALVQGSDGSFYGTTWQGGQGKAGTVFRLTMVPEFKAVTLTNGMLNLTWTADPGKTYQLQFNSDLGSTNWANLGSVLTATAGTLSFSDYATNGPTRFYRVVLSPLGSR